MRKNGRRRIKRGKIRNRKKEMRIEKMRRKEKPVRIYHTKYRRKVQCEEYGNSPKKIKVQDV